MVFCVNACFDGCLPAHIYKHLMNAVVFTKFRMKSKTNLNLYFTATIFSSTVARTFVGPASVA